MGLSLLDRHDIDVSLRVGASVGLPLFAAYAIDRLDLAVYAAFGALSSLYGRDETGSRRFETLVVAALAVVATTATALVFSAGHGPLWVLGLLLAATVIATGTLGALLRWAPRGEMFFVLVLLVLAQIPVAWTELPLAIAVTAGSAGLSVLLGVLRWHPRAERGTLRLDGLYRRAVQGFASLDRAKHCIAILAATAGALSAWLLAIALGVGHPFWAPVIVAALMPALASEDVYRRMVHLVLGTALGVGAGVLLFSWDPDHLALITMVVLCQIGAELFVGRQYGVAMMFFTPLAIGMSNLSRGLPWQPLLVDRLIEASLGTAVALIVILLSRRIFPRIAQPQLTP